MNESIIVQLVVQTGALGLCALMILYLGKKMDRLADGIYKLVQRTEVLIDAVDRRVA